MEENYLLQYKFFDCLYLHFAEKIELVKKNPREFKAVRVVFNKVREIIKMTAIKVEYK